MCNKYLSIVRGKRGFTLVEVIVALAIFTFIIAGVSMTTVQIYRINNVSQDTTLAIRQVQNAGQWITDDTIQTTTPQVLVDNGFVASGSNYTLTFRYPSSYGGAEKVIVYTLTPNITPSPQWYTLTRTVDGVAQPTPAVAEHVLYSPSPLGVPPTWFKLDGANNYEFKMTFPP